MGTSIWNGSLNLIWREEKLHKGQMLKLSYINNVANSQQNVVLRNMMSFGNITLFDTIWTRKFRILTRFFVIFNHIVTWFPTKKSMDVRPSNLWSYVLIPLGRTCIHPNAVRPHSYGRTPKEKFPWISSLNRRFHGFWESHICKEGRPQLILSHSQRRWKKQNVRRTDGIAPLCQLVAH